MAATVAELRRNARLAKEAGRFPDALAAIESALALDPKRAELLAERASILRALGRVEDARKSAHQATVASPTCAEGHAELGLSLLALNRLPDAEKSFDRALRYDRMNADALGGLGSLRLRQARLAEAETSLMAAVRARPTDSHLLVLLGDVFAARSNQAGMLEAYRRARDLDSSNTEALDKFVAAKQAVGGVDAARVVLEQAVARMPDAPIVHQQLGLFFAGHGLLEEAATSFRAVLSLEPAHAAALQYLAQSKRFRSHDDDYARILKGYELTKSDSFERGLAAFALAKAAEDLGDLGRAFDAYDEGNRVLRKSSSFSLDKEVAAFAGLERAFSAETLGRLSGAGNPSSAPIFIVGMPRSGTTLVETILSRSAGVYAAGELEAFRLAADAIAGRSPVYDAAHFVAGLKSLQLAEIGAAYLKSVPAGALDSPRFTDKMPHNFRMLGLIRLVFPNARIVHVRRDPLDNCWSMFKANFEMETLAFTRDLTQLGRYYNLYRHLMEHWRSVMPGAFFEVDYESLVGSPEATTRKLFEYCALEWSPDVLAIEASRREVTTVSFAQVRGTINTSSVNAAARYGDRLEPLRAALAEYDG